MTNSPAQLEPFQPARGAVQMSLVLEDSSAPTMGPGERVSLVLHARKDDSSFVTHKVDLPHTLALALEVSPRIWAERSAEVERLFGDSLNAEQRRAWATIVEVFRWFAAPNTHSPERPAPLALWTELHEMLTMAAGMGAFLGTPGEDLIVNVELWARRHMPLNLPPLSRSPSPV
ncbi:hypothetical protein C8Q73DRAFT_785142 [Cubamyces lactineus]|nr:hypothetical protein C8Q73DRAFT_785142 [Cubamyces lactineus]